MSFIFSILPSPSLASAAQNGAPERDAQGVLLLRNALAGVTGTTVMKDVALPGTVGHVAGPLDESDSKILGGTAPGLASQS